MHTKRLTFFPPALALVAVVMGGCPQNDEGGNDSEPQKPVVSSAPDPAEKFNKLMGEVDSRLAKGEYKSAYAILEEVSVDHGDDIKVLLRMGEASWNLGQYGESKKHHERVLKEEPQNLEANLAMLEHQLMHRELGKAEARLKAAEKGADESALAQLNAFRCRLEMARLDPEAATVAAADALKVAPALAGANLCSARTLMNSNLKEAKAHLEKVRQAKGEYPRALAVGAMLAAKGGDLDASRELLKKATLKGPHDPQVWAWAIETDMAQGDLAGATERLKSAKETLQVTFPDLVRLEAEMALTTDPKKARHLMRTLMEEHPEDPAVTLLLARSHVVNGDFDRAKEAFKTAAEQAPNHLEGLFFAGEGLMRLGRLDEAKTYFNNLLDADADRLDARLALAELHAIRRNYKSTLKAFAAAAKHTDDPGALACRKGTVLARYFPRKKAVAKELKRALQRCIKNSPSHSTAHKYLGEFFDNQKQRKKAIPAYIAHIKNVPTDSDNHFIRDRLLALKVDKKKIPAFDAPPPDITNVDTKARWRGRVGSRNWKKAVSSYQKSPSYRSSTSSYKSSSNTCYSQYRSCTNSCSYLSKSGTSAGYYLYQNCVKRCASSQTTCYQRAR